MFDYFVAVIIGFVLWLVFLGFNRRLIKPALLCGFVITPFVLVDYLMVPKYWQPVTLWNLPIGIEGFLVTFFMSGVAYIIYAKFRGFANSNSKLKLGFHWQRFAVFAPFALLVFIGCYLMQGNFIYALFLVFILSFVFIVHRQPTLLKPGIFAGLSFGVVYFLAFSVWQILAPETAKWWNYADLWGFKIGLLPAEEVVFGILLGLTVGVIFEYLTMPEKATHKGK